MEIALLLLILVSGVLGWRVRQVRRRLLAHRAVHAPLMLPAGDRALVDLFWELGATPLALELMIRRDLVPRDGVPADSALRALRDDIEAFGDWGALVEGLRETLEELEEEARAARLHRNLPHLDLPSERLLPGDAADASPILVDHDRDPSFVAWIESIFSGRLDETFGRWWQGRHLRAARRSLDQRLRELTRVVTERVPPEEMTRRLEGMVHARRLEFDRLVRLHDEHARRRSDWSLSVAALLQAAVARASEELRQSEVQSSRLMAELHEHIAANRPERAGWLLYVNRRLLHGVHGTAIPVALELVDRAAAELQAIAQRDRREDVVPVNDA